MHFGANKIYSIFANPHSDLADCHIRCYKNIFRPIFEWFIFRMIYSGKIFLGTNGHYTKGCIPPGGGDFAGGGTFSAGKS